ncbi:hypothetical protein [Phytomonospora endophytica]|uniref:Polymerase nucleotidyl transferase domain-containing protein n=1 Tax=Phytomonospora endophytica TaxID=714109 RepID=A0A841G2R3_9ACTN|nr:hypothetical protein [Phytomonospora endophytica]MBB6038420.1 hypothetical protein [Phytomonospora endophytica]GIG64349.1 hypothetical protein Pen01_06440 [Phytomonospora endophytica]
MRIEDARAAASDWLAANAGTIDGFAGAYLSGSAAYLDAGASLGTGSDVDVMVVVDGDLPEHKLGKFTHDGVLLEVTWLPSADFADAATVLASYHLAHAFSRDGILADPSGRLTRLRDLVAARFASPESVRARRDSAATAVARGIGAVDVGAPLADRLMPWMFPTGVTCHVLLVAALRNPTVRLRYLAARETLAAHGMRDRYEELLAQLGADSLTAARVAEHVDALAVTFDAAASVSRTPFPFSSDISAAARPIAIDASRELVARGDHREAVFWIAATFARCHQILAADAPEHHLRRLPAFEALAEDLGVPDGPALAARIARTQAYLPEVAEMSEKIIRDVT